MCRKYCSRNRVQILGKIRLDWFVISINLEIGFLRVKSMFLKGQVSPSLYKDGIVFLLRERKSKNYQERSSSNSGPWDWAQPPSACPISSVQFSVHLSLTIPPIYLVLHGPWSGTWQIETTTYCKNCKPEKYQLNDETFLHMPINQAFISIFWFVGPSIGALIGIWVTIC